MSILGFPYHTKRQTYYGQIFRKMQINENEEFRKMLFAQLYLYEQEVITSYAGAEHIEFVFGRICSSKESAE